MAVALQFDKRVSLLYCPRECSLATMASGSWTEIKGDRGNPAAAASKLWKSYYGECLSPWELFFSRPQNGWETQLSMVQIKYSHTQVADRMLQVAMSGGENESFSKHVLSGNLWGWRGEMLSPLAPLSHTFLAIWRFFSCIRIWSFEVWKSKKLLRLHIQVAGWEILINFTNERPPNKP